MANHQVLNQLLASVDSLSSAVQNDTQSAYDILTSTLSSTDVELTALRVEVSNLRGREQELTEHLRLVEDRLTRKEREAQEERLEAKERVKEIARLEVRLEQAQLSSPLLSTTVPTKSVKMADPEKFNGDANKVHTWASRVRAKLIGNADHFVAESGKVQYVMDRLDDERYELLSPNVSSDGLYEGCPTAFSLLDKLVLQFGDPERKAKAGEKAATYKQGNKTFREWHTTWSSYARIAEYDDSLQFNTVKRLISDELKTLLAQQLIQPDNLEKLLEYCLTMDSRLRALPNVRSYTSQSTIRPRSSSPPNKAPLFKSIGTPAPALTVSQGGDAMDLSSTRRGPLSDAEKKRRYEADLCAYCGKHKKSEVCNALAKRGNPPPRQSNPSLHNFSLSLGDVASLPSDSGASTPRSENEPSLI